MTVGLGGAVLGVLALVCCSWRLFLLGVGLATLLAAVAQDGSALRHAAEVLQRDWEVVLAAVVQNETALAYADEDLRTEILGGPERFAMSVVEYAEVATHTYIVQVRAAEVGLGEPVRLL